MKKRILSLLVVVVLMFTTLAMTASAAGLGLAVAKADVVITQPLDGNKPDTSVDHVKVNLFGPTGMEQSDAYFKVQSVSIMDYEDPTKTNFEYEKGKQYFVVVEVATVSSDSLDVYYHSIPTKEECKINGVQATDVKLRSDSDNTVLIVATILTAWDLSDVLAFGQVSPRVTAEEEQNRYTDLGVIEYGINTMFGFDHYPLTQAQKDLGFTVEEKVHVNQGGGTVVTRNSGELFDLMMYVDQVNNPFSYDWEVWFQMHLYQNGVYVTSLGHIYHMSVVPASVPYASVAAPVPVLGAAPDEDLNNFSVGGEGYEVIKVDWTDPEGIIMPGDAVFESGKTYACVVKLETYDGYRFPENKDDFSGKINGMDAEVSANYSQTQVYLTVYYSFAQYGDADSSGAVDAADALKALQHAVKLTVLEGEAYTAANVNGDDKVDATDALLMLQYTVKLIDQFPVEIIA